MLASVSRLFLHSGKLLTPHRSQNLETGIYERGGQTDYDRWHLEMKLFNLERELSELIWEIEYLQIAVSMQLEPFYRGWFCHWKLIVYLRTVADIADICWISISKKILQANCSRNRKPYLLLFIGLNLKISNSSHFTLKRFLTIKQTVTGS